MSVVSRAFSWLLDYAYVLFWQAHAVLFRTDFDDYKQRYDGGSTPTQRSAGNTKKYPPILILPGIYERWQFMKRLVDHVHDRGYEVHVVEPLGYNLKSAESLAVSVTDYVEKHSLDSVVIIAHSKGGLVGKYVMAGRAGKHIKHMIAVNTPFAGSIYAGYVFLPGVRDLSPRNAALLSLQEKREINQHITSIYARFDPHIPGGSRLPGAHNVQVEVDGHFRILGSSRLIEAIDESLGIINRCPDS
ncbi:hypothetical protein GCM10009611_17430 [Arthrobacter roseus]